MSKIILSLLLLLPGVALFAQYPDVSIYEIQEVPPGGDESPLLDDTVHVCGIVTVGTGIFYAGSGVSFYMQDSQGGPFSGIIAYCPDADLIPYLVRGDSVCFLGVVIEYEYPYDPPYTSNMTEIFILPGSFELISHGHPLPPPMIITAEMIDSTGGADSLAEQYEGVYVRLYEVTVDSVIPYSSTATWVCHDSTSHQFMVRDASDSINYLPSIGTPFRYVQGVIYHRFDNYNVQPVYMTDIIDNYINLDVWHDPAEPYDSDSVYIYVNVPEGYEIAGIYIYTRLNLAPWETDTMTQVNDTLYQFVFPPMEANTRVDYWIEVEDMEGHIITYPLEAPWDFYTFWVEDMEGIADEELSLPECIRLYQNYPNPFNASTSIAFNLKEASFVSLTIYDLLGREVAKPVEKQLAEGAHSFVLKNLNLAGGIYFYQLRAGDFAQTKRMILLK